MKIGKVMTRLVNVNW